MKKADWLPSLGSGLELVGQATMSFLLEGEVVPEQELPGASKESCRGHLGDWKEIVPSGSERGRWACGMH